MATTITQLRVFLSGPQDTAMERRLVEKTIRELNRMDPLDGVSFKLIRWEKDILPGAGNGPQDVINRAVNNQYDIFIGLLWKRMGTPTGRASSGTFEEVNEALQSVQEGKRVLPILFYFNQRAVRLHEIDPKELSRLQAFQKKLMHHLLIAEFRSSKAFTRMLRVHLIKAAKQLIRQESGVRMCPYHSADTLFCRSAQTQWQDLENQLRSCVGELRQTDILSEKQRDLVLLLERTCKEIRPLLGGNHTFPLPI